MNDDQTGKKGRPKVLVLSRNYPNIATPILGLWVEGLVQQLTRHCEVRVVAPTPYCPPLPGPKEFTKFRKVARRRVEKGVDVLHPRFITGPGYSTYKLESRLYYLSVVRQIDRLKREFDFNLIHANFGYPDGVVAAKLSRRYGVPFVITEHASWVPWMDNFPGVCHEAVRAAGESSFHIAVSGFARGTIARFTGETDRLRVIPNGVDTDVFNVGDGVDRHDPNQILYVGFMRHVKGVDVLLAAMGRLAVTNPDLKLVLVGGGLYRDSIAQENALRQKTKELGIERNVTFAGIRSPEQVAEYMRRSALLVLPSRVETFGAVLVEALACGTPVVATRCGGTEDIVNESVGILVPKEDPAALADGIREVLAKRCDYDPAELHDYARCNFAWSQIAARTTELYREALDSAGKCEKREP